MIYTEEWMKKIIVQALLFVVFIVVLLTLPKSTQPVFAVSCPGSGCNTQCSGFTAGTCGGGWGCTTSQHCWTGYECSDAACTQNCVETGVTNSSPTYSNCCPGACTPPSENTSTPIPNNPPIATMTCPWNNIAVVNRPDNYTVTATDDHGINEINLYWAYQSLDRWTGVPPNPKTCPGNTPCGQTWSFTPATTTPFYMTGNVRDTNDAWCSGNPFVSSWPISSGGITFSYCGAGDRCTMSVDNAPKLDSITASSVCNNGTLSINAVFSDADGYADIDRIGLGIVPQGVCNVNPGEAPNSNFERLLSNYMGIMAYPKFSGVYLVAKNNTGAACTGGNFGTSPWGGAPYTNVPGTATFTGATYQALPPNQLRATFSIKLNNIAGGTYNIYAKVKDTKFIWDSTNGYGSWNRVGTVNVNDSGVVDCSGATCSGSPAQKICTNACGAPVAQPCTSTINARALAIGDADACPNLPATNPIGGTEFQTRRSDGVLSAKQPQSPTSPYYTSFAGKGGNYTLDFFMTNPNFQYSGKACWRRDKNSPLTGTGLNAYVSSNAFGGAQDLETMWWDVGFSAPKAWSQTQSGDVYASDSIISRIPIGVIPRAFNLKGTSAAGVVVFGSSAGYSESGYDFAIDTGDAGRNLVNDASVESSPQYKYLANESYDLIPFYETFYNRLGAPTTGNYTGGGNKPVSCGGATCSGTTCICYVKGDMSNTSPGWGISDTDRIIFLVDGKLNINFPIVLTGPNRAGFVAFIASGDIVVSPNVGVSPLAASPQVEGVYITDGTFYTGNSSVGGRERFVGRGTFVANNFSLERDLGITYNLSYAANLFIYNPNFLIRLPDEMREVPIKWEEVKP